MHRTWAIIERELRRFRRSPMLIVMSMVMPIVQLVVLGYAFGGNVKHLKLAIVNHDSGVPAVRVRELAGLQDKRFARRNHDRPHQVLNRGFLTQVDEGVAAVLENAELRAQAEIHGAASKLFRRQFG